MDWDPRSIEALSYTLWFTLICWCDECRDWLDLSEFDHLMEEDPQIWADTVAPLVQAKGWSTPDVFELLCPRCTTDAKQKGDESF